MGEGPADKRQTPLVPPTVVLPTAGLPNEPRKRRSTPAIDWVLAELLLPAIAVDTMYGLLAVHGDDYGFFVFTLMVEVCALLSLAFRTDGRYAWIIGQAVVTVLALVLLAATRAAMYGDDLGQISVVTHVVTAPLLLVLGLRAARSQPDPS